MQIKIISVLCLLNFCKIAAQERTSYHLLDSANVAYCHFQLDKSLKLLEQFQSKNPQSALSEELKLASGIILLQKKAYKKAQKTLWDIIKLKDTDAENYQKGALYSPKMERICPSEIWNNRQLVLSLPPRELKYKACLNLHKAYTYTGLYDSAIICVDIAKKNFMPNYGGCVNGMFMEWAFLSKLKAEVYLTKGDSSMAIQEMMPHFFCMDAQRHQAFTFSLLCKKHTEPVAKQALKEGIQNARFAPDDKGLAVPRIILFGQEHILIGVGYSGKSDEDLRKELISRAKGLF